MSPAARAVLPMARQWLSWRWTILVLLLVLSVGAVIAFYVHNATTQIREALAAEVLQQQHDVSSLIQEYTVVMLALERARAMQQEYHPAQIQPALDKAIEQLLRMRSNYSFERLDGAAKAHAFAKPVLEDVQQWLTDGLPGMQASYDRVLRLSIKRMGERYEKLRLIATETEEVATSLIATQSEFLVRFRDSLIVFLLTYALVLLGIAALLLRQRILQGQLAKEQDQVNRTLIEAESRGREQAEQALKESEKFLRSTLDALTAEIAIVNNTGHIVAVNRAWREFASAGDTRIEKGGIGRPYLEVFAARREPEFQRIQTLAPDIDDVLSGQRDSLLHEYPCHYPDAQCWVVVTLTTFSVGQLRYAVLLREDVTARRQLEERDSRLRAELAHTARLSTVSEMAAGLAHELNQPLTAISHNCDALRSGMQDTGVATDEVIEITNDIYNQSQRAGGIIKSLRQMMRKDSVYTRSVALNHLVEETVRLTHPEARARQVNVTLNLASELPNPSMDPVQIQQVLVNLERNGVDAMSANTDKARELVISTSLIDQNTIRVSVQDTGPGFSAEIIDQLFSPFQTTKKGGMGLGLSISRSIVEAHGGRLWLDQEDHGKTTLHFTLPVVRD